MLNAEQKSIITQIAATAITADDATTAELCRHILDIDQPTPTSAFDTQIIEHGIEMRKAQKDYFRESKQGTRSHIDVLLTTSKRMEKEFDGMTALWTKLRTESRVMPTNAPSEYRQKDLFKVVK